MIRSSYSMVLSPSYGSTETIHEVIHEFVTNDLVIGDIVTHVLIDSDDRQALVIFSREEADSAPC